MEGRLVALEAKLSDIASDLKELKQLQVEQMRADAVDHQILKEHEKRSTQLEARVLPLEQDWVFRSRLWKLVGGGGFITLAIQAWIKFHG